MKKTLLLSIFFIVSNICWSYNLFSIPEIKRIFKIQYAGIILDDITHKFLLNSKLKEISLEKILRFKDCKGTPFYNLSDYSKYSFYSIGRIDNDSTIISCILLEKFKEKDFISYRYSLLTYDCVSLCFTSNIDLGYFSNYRRQGEDYVTSIIFDNSDYIKFSHVSKQFDYALGDSHSTSIETYNDTLIYSFYDLINRVTNNSKINSNYNFLNFLNRKNICLKLEFDLSFFSKEYSYNPLFLFYKNSFLDSLINSEYDTIQYDPVPNIIDVLERKDGYLILVCYFNLKPKYNPNIGRENIVFAIQIRNNNQVEKIKKVAFVDFSIKGELLNYSWAEISTFEDSYVISQGDFFHRKSKMSILDFMNSK